MNIIIQTIIYKNLANYNSVKIVGLYKICESDFLLRIR